MGWPKGVPRKPVTDEQLQATEEKQAIEQAQADELVDKAFADIKDSGDPQDKELYGAMYDSDFSTHTWEKSNPIEVPAEIRRANPGMAFRLRAIDSSTGQLRKGDNYDGWKVYKSAKHPDGWKFGGDTILAFMPQELANQRNKHYQEESTQLVRDLQETQLAALDRAAAELNAQGGDARTFEPGHQFRDDAGVAAGLPTGISVGATRLTDRKTGAVHEQFRGYHPEELREKAARAAEERAKHRTYGYPGQTKRS